MINIVIPMAGLGSRFQEAGYTTPKPFIDVSGKMMIERVLDSLNYPNARYTLIIRKEFYQTCQAELSKLRKSYPVNFIALDRLTQGATCTALAAHEILNNNLPVIFADSDNIFSPSIIPMFIQDAKVRQLDGSLLTFNATDPCFSYARVSDDGLVTETREKEPISDHAICGVYYYRRGLDFIRNALSMLIYGDRTCNEYYLSNTYNYAVKEGLKIGITEIPSEDWHCLGTPKQLQQYLR